MAFNAHGWRWPKYSGSFARHHVHTRIASASDGLETRGPSLLCNGVDRTHEQLFRKARWECKSLHTRVLSPIPSTR